MFDILLKPLGWFLQQLSLLFGGNFAAAVFTFTLLLNVAMIPLSIKSQKSAVGQMRMKPKLDALKKKYGDDKQRMNLETQKLYTQENVSMAGGCLPMLIRFPIMIGIYNVVLKPLTYILGVSAATLTTAATAYKALPGLSSAAKSAYQIELGIVNNIDKPSLSGFTEITDKLKNIDFHFLGINLTEKPEFNIDIFNKFDETWIIPILAFASAMLTSVLTLKMQKKINPDAPQMAGMMLTMPLVSLFIGFTVSCAAGFYWACSSLISGGIQIALQYAYGPGKMIAKEQANELYKRYEDEKKRMERGRSADQIEE